MRCFKNKNYTILYYNNNIINLYDITAKYKETKLYFISKIYTYFLILRADF